MITTLLIILLIADVGLAVAVVMLGRRQEAQDDALSELTEERQMLGELRDSVKRELQQAELQSQHILERMTKLAAEADAEVRSGRDVLGKELDSFVEQFKERIEKPLQEVNRRQMALEKLSRRIDTQKTVVQKALGRGEKLVRFFDQKVPYEEVLQELEDKKYADARHLLTKGMSPSAVAKELGMKETEVRLVAGLT